MTGAAFRKLALSLPEASEAPHFERASFRVGKKIFCTIHAPEHARTMLKLDPEDQHNLADGDAIQAVPGYWGKGGATFVWYGKLAAERLPDLVRMAWANVAPKRLLKGA